MKPTQLFAKVEQREGLTEAVVSLLDDYSKDGVCLMCGDWELKGYADPSLWWDKMPHHPACPFKRLDDALRAGAGREGADRG